MSFPHDIDNLNNIHPASINDGKIKLFYDFNDIHPASLNNDVSTMHMYMYIINKHKYTILVSMKKINN